MWPHGDIADNVADVSFRLKNRHSIRAIYAFDLRWRNGDLRKPTFDADVEYRDITTSEGLLRASSFKGLARK